MSEPNYHTTKWFSENLLAIEMKKTVIKANKLIYFGLAILALSKIKMYENWYDDMKPKYGDNVRLCYMDADSFIMHIKIEDFYKNIANDAEEKYDTSNYACERPLPMGKNKRVIGLRNDEFGRKIMKEFVGLRPKCYAYLMDDDSVDKKAKGTKKCVIKRFIIFDNCLECAKNERKYEGFNKDLKVMDMMFILKRLIKWFYHTMMIRD